MNRCGKQSPKITFVIHAMIVGGAETHLVHLLPRLQQKGFEVSLFCIKKYGKYISLIEKKGVTVYGITRLELLEKFLLAKIFYNILAMFYFWFYLYWKKSDVVHFFLPPCYIILAPVSLLKIGLIRVMSRRGLNYYQQKYPKFMRDIELRLHRYMDGILGNSKRVVGQLADDEGIERKKLQLIYNGIDSVDGGKTVCGKLCQQLRIPKTAVIMTIVANLFSYKGHQDLLEACARLEAKNWHLLIVGRDVAGNRQQFEALCTRSNISAQVHFLGERMDVPDLWQSSDIGLLVSHEEGFSNAILEAMRASLPLVVTDVGGNGEAVLAGKTGYVVPAKNPEKLARAMDRLLGDKMLRQKMGKAGKARVEKEFSMQKCVTDYQDFYEKLIAQKTKR